MQLQVVIEWVKKKLPFSLKVLCSFVLLQQKILLYRKEISQFFAGQLWVGQYCVTSLLLFGSFPNEFGWLRAAFMWSQRALVGESKCAWMPCLWRYLASRVTFLLLKREREKQNENEKRKLLSKGFFPLYFAQPNENSY